MTVEIGSSVSYQNDGILDIAVWEDLRFPVQGIDPAGAANAPTVDTSVFPGTFLFSPSLVNIIAGVAQMPHEWAKGTMIHPHVHWSKVTSAAGGVVWEYRYAIANPASVFGAYSAWEPCTYPVPDSNVANQHAIAEWSYTEMTGKRESTIILWQIRRNTAAGADTYADNARLYEFDIHYQIDKAGTKTELPV